MKTIVKIFSLFSIILMLTSCNNKKSLQGYLVESQEKKGFITVDVPSSILQLKSTDVSKEVKETLNSIRKVNVVALPIKDNKEAYEIEKTALKTIFKENEEAYKSLMTVKAKGMNVNVFYTGDTDSIDEIIVFGYGDEVGVGIARLLGEDMNPAMVMEMIKNIKLDENSLDLKELSGVF
ncbi:DUF4252 domain-containing protein [Polaribacter sargassicola]|uniref:DUF4252 domain-containing protein n=1 Tax=Polaribacter sargassicola TaxID=2836891 RepID=UPI001F1B7A26|nr:DUF4252 domain-containing protein [Polaribacter sp. DS7-9]MCG1036863.1 DUF4252 domain-containing protein [Polaribacter sp. DS7-9]